jgi:hypothetical protein
MISLDSIVCGVFDVAAILPGLARASEHLRARKTAQSCLISQEDEL